MTTVSHVFSGKRHVSEKTRERVLAAAKNLGYAPNANALGLATGRSMTFGLHVSFAGGELMLNPFFTSMLPAMSSAALERGYSFILLPSQASESRPTLRRLLDDRRIDGMLLVDPEPSTELHTELARRNKPFVSTGRIIGVDDHLWVDNDHREACLSVLEHLAEQGYERPALLAVRGEQSFIRDYERGYYEWCEGAGVKALVVWARTLTEPDGYEAAALAISDPARPDALVCMHDRLAIGALRALRDAGVTVPDDVGVAGSTDTLFAAHAVPRLTSVQLFPERMGETAVELLLLLVNGTDIESVLIPTEVIVRDSTLRR